MEFQEIEALHGDVPRGAAHLRKGVRVGQQSPHRPGEARAVEFIHEQAGATLFDRFRDPGVARRDHRAARGHGLLDRGRQTFGIALGVRDRVLHEDGRPREAIPHEGMVAQPVEKDAAVEAQRRCARFGLGPHRSVADDLQTVGGEVRRDLREGLQG